MIEELLPPEVEVVSARGDVTGAELYPEEAETVAAAVPKRRAEFATGRHCARRALARLGVPPGPLLPGRRGAPGWPEGTLGSLTHCDGYRAAAVARRGDVRALGIDAEPNGPVPRGVLGGITVGGEAERLARLAAARPQVHWDRLLFSAKEAVYKAWFPLTGRWLGFPDAELDFRDESAAPGSPYGAAPGSPNGAAPGSPYGAAPGSPNGAAPGSPNGSPCGAFTARLLVPGHGALTGFHGRWAVRDGLVVTAVAVSATAVPERHV
ncbi:4'-phosphopantetheinyl transferase superfamily protein [Streptomyces albiaxialis]|uniref:4'-phosphopantetheinyl transferase superfamily protein n=1 Tax=Streptomyces albiaxialis TaxID=329523 RepID=A0ABN2WJY0_9ACTN